MARQSEFPWLKRWSRAVLAVVWVGLVLAASPALGKWYNIPSVNVEEGMINYMWGVYRNGDINIYATFGQQLPSNRGPFRDEDIPVYPERLWLAGSSTFVYTIPPGYPYSFWGFAIDSPGECRDDHGNLCFTSVAGGELFNINRVTGNHKDIWLWISKVEMVPGFWMYRLGVSLNQQWLLRGSFQSPNCAWGEFDLSIPSFETVLEFDLWALEDVADPNYYNGVLSYDTWEAPLPDCGLVPAEYYVHFDLRLNIESENSDFFIYATAGPNGAISPAGAVSVNNGASQVFSITPNTGYHVADVLVDGVSVGAVTTYTFPTITADHTIAATFGAGVTAISILTDKDKVRVPPGKTAPLQVKLSGAPSASVEVTVVRQSGSTALSIQGPAKLTFTPANWNTYQTVQIAATAGKTDINATAVFQLSASGLTGKQVSAVKGATGGIAPKILLLLDK